MLLCLKIETKLDLPVGKGLFDHLTYPLYFNLNATRSSGSVNLATLLNPANLVQYALASQGNRTIQKYFAGFNT